MGKTLWNVWSKGVTDSSWMVVVEGVPEREATASQERKRTAAEKHGVAAEYRALPADEAPDANPETDYARRLRQTVIVSVDTLRETPRKAQYVKGTRRARFPFDRAAQIRALTDLIAEAQHQLDEEIMLARDPAATAPVVSYTAIGLSAGLTRQAAYEQVSGGRRLRPVPRGPLAVTTMLIADDDE